MDQSSKHTTLGNDDTEKHILCVHEKTFFLSSKKGYLAL
jgi:hypothetical protein